MLQDLHYLPARPTDLASQRELLIEECTTCLTHKTALNPIESINSKGEDTSDFSLISSMLRSAKTGSMTGASGFAIEYFAQIASTGNTIIMASLVHLIAYIANGGTLVDGSSFVISACVALALIKGKQGDTLGSMARGIRPICIGEALRRLAGHIVLRKFQQLIACALLPLQFGVAVPSGVEIMFNLVRIISHAHPDWAVCGTDIKSAFQRMPRLHVIRTLRAHDLLSHLLPFFASFYLDPATCSFGTLFTFLSAEGCQQGCPIGSFAWAIGLHPLLMKVAKAYPDVFIAAYCDDVWMVGPPERAAKALDMLNELLKELACRTHTGAPTCLEFSYAQGKSWVYSIGPNTLDLFDHNIFPSGTQFIPSTEGYHGLGCFASANDSWIKDIAADTFATQHAPIHDILRKFACSSHGPSAQSVALLASSCATTNLHHLARLVATTPILETVS